MRQQNSYVALEIADELHSRPLRVGRFARALRERLVVENSLYKALRLEASDWLAARRAGKRPPKKPIAAANSIPITNPRGVTRNANATSLNDDQFVVLVVMPLIGKASRQPITPPTNASSTDSIRNESMIEPFEKPSVSSTAISRVRCETAAYIVFMAPKIAPTAMISVITTPATRI